MAVISALSSVIRGLAGAVIGLILGYGLSLFVTSITDRPMAEIAMAISYPFALIGWLLGIGVWKVWAREWVGLKPQDNSVHGWQRFFSFSLDHKVIGVQYLTTFVVLFLLAGLMAMLIRLELLAPGTGILDAGQFNTVMGLHGIIMIAVAVATIMGGFANFLVPLMIGADDVAFPRINALSFWIVPPVAILLILTPVFGGFDSGWTAYPPLSVINADGQVLFLLAFITFGFSSILGGLNFLTTIITLRAPGMTWGRLPIFVWSVFAASMISLTATQVVAFGLLMVLLDRVGGTSFFSAALGGKPLLYEHVFWFYSHPAVYIMILPAFGIELEILSHFSRKPVYAYKWVVGAFMSIVALSFLVWAHHLFTSGMENYLHIPFMAVTELISIPTGAVFLSALGTMWMGKLWLRTPMLFAMGVIFNFLIGGITGIFLADVATDINLQDTYFVVAHFHYTMVGGEIFAIFAAIYYWFPKITGRSYNEALGKLHFWWMFLAYNVTFIAMFFVGIQGMNRRVADYPEVMANGNMVVSLAAFALGASFLVFVYNMVRSWVAGPIAEANPWRARTLEWLTSSPPPHENFDVPPVVVGDPYGYGTPDSEHARFGPTEALGTAGGDD
ncbi:MAG: cbb3-type cytochrome c oxidase subunit I [Chloroflexi bacterium]|nr:cbb3-type cytochrome c oxidase subunit I [Chloroflexota bacterium]MDA1227264.1 cbb3-type cytochrome c oxidase subunit I [Chloroflexota bacterium]